MTYGVILTTARALGEFGAVSIVSGETAGRTSTFTVHVEEQFQQFDLIGAYTSSLVLAVIALVIVLGMTLLEAPEAWPMTINAIGITKRYGAHPEIQ